MPHFCHVFVTCFVTFVKFVDAQELLEPWYLVCSHVCCFVHVGEMEASTTITANQGVKTATFYGWKYSHYFVVVNLYLIS